MHNEVIVCDLGGTSLRLAVGDESGSLQATNRLSTAGFVSRSQHDTWEKIMVAISQYVCQVHERVSRDAPVILAFPGPVDQHQRILNAPAIADGGAFDICGRLRDCLKRPVCVINDVSAAAWYYGTRADANRLLILSVGTGIGSKILDRSRRWPVVDEVPYAGELGHIVVDASDTAIQCGCGGRGHLESIASGNGVQRLARERAGQDRSGFDGSACAHRFLGEPAFLTNEGHIVPSVHLRDTWATQLVRDCTRPLAQILTIVATASGVERVVLIGGFALSLGERYVAILREEIRACCDYRPAAALLPASLVLGDERDATLRGAAMFAKRAREEQLMSG